MKALAHQIRSEALAILNERVASPNEIAKELGHSVGHVAYHIKVLKDCECVELVDTAPRRGAMEHYYRATATAFIDTGEWTSLPASIRDGMSGGLLQLMLDDAREALERGTFDALEDRHMSWTRMIADEEGWHEVRDLLEDTLRQVLAIKARNAERLEKADEAGIPLSIGILGFETADGHTRVIPKKER